MASDHDLPGAEQPAGETAGETAGGTVREKPARRATKNVKAAPRSSAAPQPEAPSPPEAAPPDGAHPYPPGSAEPASAWGRPSVAQPGWPQYPYPPAWPPYPYPAARPAPYPNPYAPAPYPYPYAPAPYPNPYPSPYPPAAAAAAPAAQEELLPWGQRRPPTPWGSPPAPPPPAPAASPQAPLPPAPAAPAAPYPYAPAAPYPYAPAAWPTPFPAQPWPYGYPPVAPLPYDEPEPPGSQHPPAVPRPVASLAGRASPRLYAAGWALSVAGAAAFFALLAASAAELTSAIPGAVRLVALEVSLAALTAGLGAAAIAQSRQRREDGWQDYFGPAPLLATGVMLALSFAAAVPILTVADWLGIEATSSVEVLLALLINLACYVAVTYWLAVRTGALTWSDIARPGRLAPSRGEMVAAFWRALRPPAVPTRLRSAMGDVGLGLGLAVPGMIGSLILAGVMVIVLGLKDAPASGESYQIVTDLDFWIVFAAVAVVAPIGEEIFFRGFLTNAWGRSLDRSSALLRGAVLFASVHILNNAYDINALDLGIRLAILAVVVRLPVAWLLGWIYTSRRSILASISLHSAYNGALVALSWWAVNQSY